MGLRYFRQCGCSNLRTGCIHLAFLWLCQSRRGDEQGIGDRLCEQTTVQIAQMNGYARPAKVLLYPDRGLSSEFSRPQFVGKDAIDRLGKRVSVLWRYE